MNKTALRFNIKFLNNIFKYFGLKDDKKMSKIKQSNSIFYYLATLVVLASLA